MSVNPYKNKPFTESEKAYLLQFSWGASAIEDNKRRFGTAPANPVEPPAKPEPVVAVTPVVLDAPEPATEKTVTLKDPDTGERVTVAESIAAQVKGLSIDEVKNLLSSSGLSTTGATGALRARLAIAMKD